MSKKRIIKLEIPTKHTRNRWHVKRVEKKEKIHNTESDEMVSEPIIDQTVDNDGVQKKSRGRKKTQEQVLETLVSDEIIENNENND